MKRFVMLSFLILAAACTQHPGDALQGYGEADYVYLASQESGVVAQLFVREGDAVAAGAPVFRLEPDRLSLSARSAAAQRNALQQALNAARANARLAEANYARTAQLFRDGFASTARLDADRAARDAAAAGVREAERRLNAAAADSGLAQTRLGDLDVAAPAAGTIEEIFHRPGEVVAAGAPVAALLPPANMKVRFFAPQALLARFPVGARVTVYCDGCTEPIGGRVTFVAQSPEFTPPVIYSLDQRAKLVFLIEARLDAPDRVRPGMPVDVRLAR
jgi:HlyD family secretion protein